MTEARNPRAAHSVRAVLMLAIAVAVVTTGVARAAVAGDFQPAATSPEAAGEGPSSVATADFNRDTRPDLAVTNQISSDVTVLLGAGAGDFVAAPTSPEVAADTPINLVAARLNGDANPDLAFTRGGSTPVIEVLLGDGTGNFSTAITSPEPVAGGSTSIAVGRFNADPVLDLAVGGGSRLTVLLGDGTGNFTAAPTGPETLAGCCPIDIAVGHFNADAHQDVAIVDFQGGGVAILLGDGTGNLTAAPTSPEAIGFFGTSIATGDFNNDSRQDLAVGDTTNGVTIMLGDGSGDFAPAPTSPEMAGAFLTAIAVADLDSDSNEDLAVADGSSSDVAILLGDGLGDFAAAATSPEAVESGPASIAVADFNGESAPDLAVANHNTGNVAILLNQTPAPTTCLGVEATIVGSPGDDVLNGTPGADVIVGLAGDDQINSGSGNDVVCAGLGDDVVNGGFGNDRLVGGNGRDSLTAAAGNDTLYGDNPSGPGGGPDNLSGGFGADTFFAGPASDSCTGGPGTDSDPNGECEVSTGIP